MVAKRSKRLNWKVLSKRKLTRDERAAFARECLGSFRSFCRLCEPPTYDWATGHGELEQAMTLSERGPDGRIRTLTLGPRGCGKSTLLGERYTLWRICRSALDWPDEPYKNGAIRILYATETAEKANKKGQWLLGKMDGSNIPKVFGTFVDRRLWGAEQFIIRQRRAETTDPTFTAVSPDKSSTGGHFDLVIVDDPVTYKNTRTLQSMAKLREWFEDLLAQLDPGGEIRVTGSRYHEMDLYGTIMEHADLWTCVTFDVERHSFPNLTPEFLVAQKSEFGTARYSAYYLNNPFPSELRVFNPETFQWMLRKDMPDVAIYLLADLASSEDERSCETVYTILGVDAVRNKYLLDLARGHFLPDQSMKILHRLFAQWRPMYGAMENRVLTNWVRSLIQAKERDTGLAMPFEIISAKGYLGKSDHILSLEPDFEARRFYFVDTLPREEVSCRRIGPKMVLMGKLIDDLLKFPKAKKKDALDCIANSNERLESGALVCSPPRGRQKQPWGANRQKSPWHMPRFSHRPMRGWMRHETHA